MRINQTEHIQPILNWPNWSKTDLLFVLLLLATVVCLHSEMVFHGQLSLDEDTLLFFYPLRAISQDPFVGLWDPYLFCGFPRDGNPQSQLLYPPNIVLNFLSAPHAYTVLLVGHLALGVLGVYLLARFFRCGAAPSLIAALAFASGGFWRCKAVNLGNMEGNAWIPFLLLTFIYGLERRSLKWALLAGIFASLIIGAGAPHPVIFAALLCGLCFLFIQSTNINRRVLFGLTVAAIALALSAWSWLPAMEYMPRSNRAPLIAEEAYSGSLAIRDLPGALLCGLTQNRYVRLDPWEGTVFFPIGALILAGWGMWTGRKRREVWLFATASVIGILFALGPNTPVYPMFRSVIPGASYLNLPNRALLLAAWSVPIFVAFGAQSILDSAPRLRVFLIAAILCLSSCAAITIDMVFNYPFYWQAMLNPSMTQSFNPESSPDWVWMVWNVFLGAACFFLVFSIPAHGRWNRRPHFMAIAVLIVLQGIYVAPRYFFEFTSPDFFDPPASTRYIQERQQTLGGRAVGHSKEIPTLGDVRCPWIVPHLGHRFPEIFRIPEIQGYDPLYPKVYGELIRRWAGQARASNPLRNVQLKTIPERLIDFLGVHTIVGDPASRLCELPEVALAPGAEKNLRFTHPITATRVFLRHVCKGMADLENGEQVGTLTLGDSDGDTYKIPVRYGLDVAALLPSSPSETREARLFHWWPIPYMGAYSPAVNYWRRWRLEEPFEIHTVHFQNEAPKGVWHAIEIVLTDAKRRRYPLLFQDNGVEVYANPSAFRPAWIASSYQVVSDVSETVECLMAPETDLRQTIFLQTEPQPSLNDMAAMDAMCNVDYERPSSDEIICRADSESSGFLVVTEGYSPWWQATINNESVPIYKADGAFMAVPLKKGAGTVHFLYQPTPFYVGCAVSVVMWLLCALLWLAIFAKLASKRSQNAMVDNG